MLLGGDHATTRERMQGCRGAEVQGEQTQQEIGRKIRGEFRKGIHRGWGDTPRHASKGNLLFLIRHRTNRPRPMKSGERLTGYRLSVFSFPLARRC